MRLSERLPERQRGPQLYLHSGMQQSSRHYQPITTVVARSHQHQHALFQTLSPLKTPISHRLANGLHQGGNGQTTPQPFLLQRQHLFGADETVLRIKGRPDQAKNTRALTME